MIRRVLDVAAWLGIVAAAAAALYWEFLNTTESQVLTLFLSAVLVTALIVVAAVGGSAAVLLAQGESRKGSLTKAARRPHWFLLATLSGALLVRLILRGDAWIARYSGEISAWFIATFNLADVTSLFVAEAYVSLWLRWVVIPVGALAAVASALQYGAGAVVSSRWIRAACRWQSLAATTGAFVLLIALPWRMTTWQPSRVTPVWMDPALAGLRLLIVGIVMLVGAAIVVLITARAAGAPGRD